VTVVGGSACCVAGGYGEAQGLVSRTDVMDDGGERQIARLAPLVGSTWATSIM
jgi:hypothetical protein